jgi:hypothetical protein
MANLRAEHDAFLLEWHRYAPDEWMPVLKSVEPNLAPTRHTARQLLCSDANHVKC